MKTFFNEDDLNRDVAPISDHFVPIVFEPVANNFKNLVQHYKDLQTRFSLPCVNLMRRAVNYPQDKKCSFYTFNSRSTDPECLAADPWMKEQIGTLQKEWMLKFWGT